MSETYEERLERLADGRVAGVNLRGEMQEWQVEAAHEAAELWAAREAIREDWRKDDIKVLRDGRWHTSAGEISDDITRTDIPRDDAADILWISGHEVDERNPSPGRRWTRAIARCGVRVAKGRLAGKRCPNPAGQGTAHVGAGSCVAHTGAKARGRALGAWLMAHGFAQQLNVNPWDALLMSVRIAAGKVAYIEYVLGTAKDDLELEGRFGRGDDDGLLLHPDTGEPLGVGQYRNLAWWVEKGEIWHERLARCAKMAVDAGIAAWQVEKVEAEAQNIARVLNAVIEGMEGALTDTQISEMRALMRRELLRLDEEQTVTQAIEGFALPK